MDFREKRRRIFQETLSILSDLPARRLLGIPEPGTAAPTTRVRLAAPAPSPPPAAPPAVRVVNEDCVRAAQRCLEEWPGCSVLLLNMASPSHPGGGVVGGAGAQEENLFRRSNYVEVLPKGLYPIPEREGLYTPAVHFFRGPEAEGYQVLQRSFAVGAIAVAALRHPQLTASGTLTDADARLTKDKIRVIFKAAVDHGHDVVVVSALGCGAFRNPPEEIARLFGEVIRNEVSSEHIKMVVFAIIEDHNSRGGGNRAPFDDVFSRRGV